MNHPSHFVTTQWLEDHLNTPDLVVVDASWYLHTMNRDGFAEYQRQHIPKAVFFDIEAISDHSNPLPHMLPDPISFASAMSALGIGDGMKIIVYDGMGLFTAPRVWWTLRAFGARDVHILEGGLPKWLAEGRLVDDRVVSPQKRQFTARLDHSMVANLEDVRAALKNASAQVLDARPAARFRGEAPEPRAGLRSGHMPNSLNLPFGDVITDGCLKDKDSLTALFAAAGVDISKPVITSCGSGVSASILTLALDVIGAPMGKVYDGSWTEWGGRADLPIETV